jgi:hypothetical protein
MGLDLYFYRKSKQLVDDSKEIMKILEDKPRLQKSFKELYEKYDSTEYNEIAYFRNSWEILDFFGLENCEDRIISDKEFKAFITELEDNGEALQKNYNNSFEYKELLNKIKSIYSNNNFDEWYIYARAWW